MDGALAGVVLNRLFFPSIVGGLLIASTADAMAYLDPVTGSFLLQGLIGGVVAGMVAIRSVRDRVLGMFRSKKTKPAERDGIDTPA